jgi:class 3 adenylate cyclase
LADAGSLEGERKTVTALFADIKGSMDMMEDLDPEVARAIYRSGPEPDDRSRASL